MLHLITRSNPLSTCQNSAQRANRSIAEQLAPVQVIESAERFVLLFDLPGVAPENVDLQISANRLTLSAKRLPSTIQDGEKLLRSEAFSGTWVREFNLPQDIDANRIEAKYQHGVLSVLISKRTEFAARKISIAA